MGEEQHTGARPRVPAQTSSPDEFKSPVLQTVLRVLGSRGPGRKCVRDRTLIRNKFPGHALSSAIDLVMNVPQKFRVENVHPNHLSHPWHLINKV